MEDYYEPSDRRYVLRPTNYFETALHLIKASVGTGILAIPKGFSDCGYVFGIIGTILVSLLCIYCLRTLVNVQYELCRRYRVPAMSYAETAVKSFQEGPNFMSDKYVHFFAQFFVLASQLGAACVYLIFVAHNVMQVIEYYLKTNFGLRWYMLMSLVPCFLLGIINNLKHLELFSFFAHVTTIAAFCILFYYLFSSRSQKVYLTAFGSILDFPLFISTVVFAMEPIGVVLPLEHEMKNPKHFTSRFGVLNVSMIPISVLYIIVGFFGYLQFGDKVDGSITLTLPTQDVLAQICKLLYSFAIFTNYGLYIFYVYDTIWKEYCYHLPLFQAPDVFIFKYQYYVRVVLMLFTFICAIAIPNIELFIALVGAFSLATSGIAFPAIFNWFCYWNSYEGSKFVVFTIWCMFVILLGFLFCIIGVTVSIIDIIRKFYV